MSKKSCSGCLIAFILLLLAPLPIAILADPISAYLLATELDSWYVPPRDPMQRAFCIVDTTPHIRYFQ